MVEALLDVAWLPLVGTVGVAVLLCAALLLMCCAKGAPSSPVSTEAEHDSTWVNPERKQMTRAKPKQSPEPIPGQYLNVPVAMGTVGTMHSYMNISATGTKFQPVKFNIDKVIGTLRKKLQPYLIDHRLLELQDVVGKGAFGLVYRGMYKDKVKGRTLVAVKTVHGDECSPADMKSFLEEVVRMFGFSHVNVQSTTGICFLDKQPYAVMPFMECGDLRSFLLTPDLTLTLRHLFEFALQIAKGMEYLSGLKFVHRDLATRNCMINNEHVIKVADFGLSRDIFYSDYYRMKPDSTTPLPTRWMAVESLSKFVFTTKSDIWSFGVVAWELMTRGQTPYATMPSKGAMEFVKSGGRLEKPVGCPSPMYTIMAACWTAKPDKRPSFPRLVTQIHSLLGDN